MKPRAKYLAPVTLPLKPLYNQYGVFIFRGNNTRARLQWDWQSALLHKGALLAQQHYSVSNTFSTTLKRLLFGCVRGLCPADDNKLGWTTAADNPAANESLRHKWLLLHLSRHYHQRQSADVTGRQALECRSLRKR